MCSGVAGGQDTIEAAVEMACGRRALASNPRHWRTATDPREIGAPVDRSVDHLPSRRHSRVRPRVSVHNRRPCPQMTHRLPSYYHLHLVSDSTGETLTTIAMAASVLYPQVRPIEHVHSLVRTSRQLERVLQEIESAPVIVLYTVVNH